MDSTTTEISEIDEIALNEQLKHVWKQLTLPQKIKVLGFARQQTLPPGPSLDTLLKHSGSIAPDELDRIQEAIDGIDKAEPNA